MHARGVPCVGVLYYHPVNVGRLGRVKNDPTPWIGVEKAGRQQAFARVFEAHGVRFVNTSVLNTRFGHRAMLNTTRGIWSAAHISPLGHQGVADLLIASLLANCSAAFWLPPPPPPGTAQEYYCRIGASLNGMRKGEDLAATAAVASHEVSAASQAAISLGEGASQSTRGAVPGAWQMYVPSDGRTAGLVTTAVNMTLRLLLPPPSSGRFLSLGIEASYKHDAVLHVGCHGSCRCAPFAFDAHSRKRYTYLQRTKPVWIAPAVAAAASSPLTCELAITPTRLTAGRLMIKAVTMASPRPGNRSVSVRSLYALQ